MNRVVAEGTPIDIEHLTHRGLMSGYVLFLVKKRTAFCVTKY